MIACVPSCVPWREAPFSAAAKELGVGQPAISKRIALLEDEFGTQLFLRTTRKLKPTAEAHRVYDLARQILGAFDMARSSVEQTASRPTGTLRIGVPSSFGRRYMIPIVADYVRNYPEVRVDIRFSERFVNLVEEGIELALRIGNLEASTLVARRLGTVQRRLVATPTYLHGRPTPRTPEDLNAHQCIVYSRGSRAHEWTFESEHGRHVAAISGPILVDDADAMQEATMQHLGIAVAAGLECGGGTAQRRARNRPSGIFDRRLAACMRFIRRCTGCRCGREAFSICWWQRADRFAPEAGG